jgi:VIT1/CCC1 family predicted Fe2+/Mn2+ transporter
MDNELGMADVRDDNALAQGFITLFSFLVFGAIPLVPYLFMSGDTNLWMVSVAMTGASLVLLGVVRRYVTKMNLMKTVGQMVILGAAAAGVAYWTGDIVMKLQG